MRWLLILVDALLIACFHRAVHKYYEAQTGYGKYVGERFIWLYDIHLLLGALSPAQHADFIARADAKGLRAICRETIELVRACFQTPVSAEIIDALSLFPAERSR